MPIVDQRTVRTLKLTIAYDGTAYAGWQFQPDRPTVQQTLETALKKVTGEQIRDAMAQTSVKDGEIIRTGSDEFARAVALVQQGKSINYEGASGPMDFDALGNVTDRLARFQAKKGAFMDVARFDCVHDSKCPLEP